MAFTAVHYPTNKDQSQLPSWLDSEELGVASDNFFDQFVSFDSTDPLALAGDLLENPPSPSILLEDTLNGSLTNSSSNNQDTQSGQSQNDESQTDVATLLDLPPIPPCEEPALEHSQSVPPELTTPLFADPVLSGGSISDSELLRLEGISIKSPKTNATTPSTPPFPTTSAQAPRKHSRVLDSLYATFRRVTHKNKPQKPQGHSQIDIDALEDALKKESSSCYDIPGSLDWNDFADIKLEDMPVPVDDLGIPLSPPLTGRIPPEHSNNTMDFVNGDFDDPFIDGLLGPPAVIHAEPKNLDINLTTPMATPGLNDDPFYQNGMGVMDTSRHSYRSRQPKQHRSTSSAEWPMEGILTNDNPSAMWPSSSSPGAYPDGVPSPEWWDTEGHHGHHRYHGIHNNAALNLSMHNHQADLAYEYSNNPDMSGLMIHMPQPRTPQAAVLTSGMHHDVMMSPSSHYYPAPSSGHRHHHRSSSSSHPHYSERRPRPRAPSSGARHHGHHGSMTSPRKMSSCYALREESMSPTPHHRHRSASSGSSATPLTVRKRRSWTRRQEPRTPRSVSFDNHGRGRHHGHEESRGGGGSGSGSSGNDEGGGLSIEFCNYTPNDKKVLMNGVAPSGSSKTKARREKEAMEHKRQMSEAYIQAIRAAGGDVEKLRRDGFFNQHQSEEDMEMELQMEMGEFN